MTIKEISATEEKEFCNLKSEIERTARRGWVTHEEGETEECWQQLCRKTPGKQLGALPKRLSLLKPQIHPEETRRGFLHFCLPGTPWILLWARCVHFLFWRGQSRLEAVFCWKWGSPWWMKPHRVIYVVWASHWLKEAEACASLICQLSGKPLTAHLRRRRMHYTPGESKLDRVRCSRGTLPSPEETTTNHRRSGSSTRRKRIMMSTPAIYQRNPHQCQACSLYMTAWESDAGTGKVCTLLGHYL